MIGKQTPPCWLATDDLLLLFDKNRQQAIKEYIQFVQSGHNVTIWDNLQHQIFLGDDEFVNKYLPLQNERLGDLNEIPLKQRRYPPLSLTQYQAQFSLRDEVIIKAYESGGYTLKEIGAFFKLHYSRVSRIVAKGKT